MSPAEEACEILPEKSQAGELGGKVFQQRSMIQNYFYFKKKKKKTQQTSFLSNIDKQSAPSFVLDKMTEEEDDAYDFSTDYV